MYAQLAQVAFSAWSDRQAGKAAAERAGDAAYKQVSEHMANRFRATMRMDSNTKSISAVRQDGIISNLKIKEAEAKAKADAKVAAAFAGVDGGSVQDVTYMAEVNGALTRDAALKQREQEKSNYANQIYGAAYNAQQKLHLPKIHADYSKAIETLGNTVGSLGKSWGTGRKPKTPYKAEYVTADRNNEYSQFQWQV